MFSPLFGDAHVGTILHKSAHAAEITGFGCFFYVVFGIRAAKNTEVCSTGCLMALFLEKKAAVFFILCRCGCLLRKTLFQKAADLQKKPVVGCLLKKTQFKKAAVSEKIPVFSLLPFYQRTTSCFPARRCARRLTPLRPNCHTLEKDEMYRLLKNRVFCTSESVSCSLTPHRCNYAKKLQKPPKMAKTAPLR